MSIRFEPNDAGVAELLNSAGVHADINRRGEAMRAAAESAASGILVEGEPGDEPVSVEGEMGGDSRARYTLAITHPSGLAVEAKHRILGGALDAAGG